MCPEFIAECPEAVELMQTLGLQVFVPQNWDGARIDALKLRFSPDFPVTLHARLIPVNPRLYAHAKKEFDRLCQYHLVPSNAPYSCNLVIAPKETAPFVRLCGNYIPINKYILSSIGGRKLVGNSRAFAHCVCMCARVASRNAFRCARAHCVRKSLKMRAHIAYAKFPKMRAHIAYAKFPKMRAHIAYAKFPKMRAHIAYAKFPKVHAHNLNLHYFF